LAGYLHSINRIFGVLRSEEYALWLEALPVDGLWLTDNAEILLALDYYK
jgi:hypothetical protein